MQRFDVQRVAAEQACGQRVMNVRLDCAGAVEGFAEADDAGVGVHAGPDDVGKLFGAKGFDGGDLHASWGSWFSVRIW